MELLHDSIYKNTDPRIYKSHMHIFDLGEEPYRHVENEKDDLDGGYLEIRRGKNPKEDPDTIGKSEHDYSILIDEQHVEYSFRGIHPDGSTRRYSVKISAREFIEDALEIIKFTNKRQQSLIDFTNKRQQSLIDDL